MLDELLSNKLKYNYDQDGYNDRDFVVLGSLETDTRSYKLIVTERAIWANEIPILKVDGYDQAKRTARNFERMLEASLPSHDTYVKAITIDWDNFENVERS